VNISSVDIGGIDDHYCLNFLFMIVIMSLNVTCARHDIAKNMYYWR